MAETYSAKTQAALLELAAYLDPDNPIERRFQEAVWDVTGRWSGGLSTADEARMVRDTERLLADIEDDRGFEGVGDFYSDDPYERWAAHQAAKGRW